MVGIEIFSGAGGMSLGASLAGIEVKIAVELNPYAAETYARNHLGTTVITGDITEVKKFRFKRSGNEIVLFGGPPCQGFSNSNQKTRSKENPKNWLFTEFLRCVASIRPDWVVIENVKGLATTQGGFFLKRICNDLNLLGYTVNFKVLNAVDFGVPQKRERIFIVGSSKGISFSFPKPLETMKVTVSEAIIDLPDLLNGSMIHLMEYKQVLGSSYSKLMRGLEISITQNYVTKNSDLVVDRYSYIPQGGNWKCIPDVLMTNYKDHTRCHHGIYRRLKVDEPSNVIGNFRKNMLIHPTQHRGLSLREAARLQSFPDRYQFYGPLVSQQQQVGDAVPPLLSKAVFEQISTLH